MTNKIAEHRSGRPTFREKLLLFLSRQPESDDYDAGRDHWTSEDALSQLCRFFPDFLTYIADKEILDFGCGTGYQSVELARMGAKYVVGLDVNSSYLGKARQLAHQNGLAAKVTFFDHFDNSLEGRFDVVISQNSMEHFPDPAGVLNKMKLALKKDGAIFITFGPPWFAPFGSHMHFFVSIPWINIWFDEKTVIAVRNRFRKDGASQYEEVEGGLNRMTANKFEALLRKSGLQVTYQRYDCVRGLDFLGQVPLVRELFVNQISCIVVPQVE